MTPSPPPPPPFLTPPPVPPVPQFDRYDFPEEWATCHATNAKLFTDRSSGQRKNNIENGLYHIENALQVYTARTHPLPWSDLAMLACTLFRERVSLHEAMAPKRLKTGADQAMVDGERAVRPPPPLHVPPPSSRAARPPPPPLEPRLD